MDGSGLADFHREGKVKVEGRRSKVLKSKVESKKVCLYFRLFSFDL
jgi:hypothetical protein